MNDTVNIVDINTPREVAQSFLNFHAVEGFFTLRWHRNQHYQYLESRWVPISETCLQAQLSTWLSHCFTRKNEKSPPEFVKVKERLVKEIVFQFNMLTIVNESIDQCEFSEIGGVDSVKGDYLVMANGVLDLESVRSGEEIRFEATSPRFFTTKHLPFPFDKQAKCPVFMSFLASVSEKQTDLQKCLQLMVAYIVFGGTDLQFIFLIHGVSRSGKGTFVRLLTELLGPGLMSAPSLPNLCREFAFDGLVGKRLLTCTDAHSAGDKSREVVETLLRISGEDPIDVHRKHKPTLTGVRLNLVILLVMNELVPLPDTSGALLARLVVFPFMNSFQGREDPDLFNKLKGELTGIFIWALAGYDALKNLREKPDDIHTSPTKRVKEAMQPTHGRESLGRLNRRNSAVKAFIEDRLIIEVGAKTLTSACYGAYTSWCEENGHKPLSQTALVDELASATDHRAVETRPSAQPGQGQNRPRFIENVKLVGGKS
jgi:P4 family phage/plasmid primase-like protien